jgi:hypothetical protein
MKSRIAGLAAVVLVCVACAHSPFVATWTAPNAEPFKIAGQKVAAVAIIEDVASRRAAEDAIAQELTARGAIATPMYMIYPTEPASDEPMARAALERQGFTGLVVFRPLSTEREIVSTQTFAGPPYSRYWGGYFGFGWRMPWRTVELRTNTIVTLETLVYSLTQNTLVWGGQSRLTNPGTIDRMVRDTARQVNRELERQGLITPTKT